MTRLTELQDWFATQCDGEWEHQHGIAVATIDNPGWHVRIELQGTAQAGPTLAPVETSRSEDDWYRCSVQNEIFEGFGGVRNLDDILGVFLAWAKVTPD